MALPPGSIEFLLRWLAGEIWVLCTMAGERFPPYVEAALRKAGWYPGRRIVDEVDVWVGELCTRHGHSVFPKALEFLQEFGALSFPDDERHEPFNFLPTEMADADEYAAYMEALGTKLFPLGDGGQGSDLMMSEDGRVFRLWSGSVLLVGEQKDEAVVNLLLHRPSTELLQLLHW